MGLLDLFRSRSSNLQPDPRLRWFGKLPSDSDYLSSPADAPWAIEFNEWVMRGYEAYRRRMAESATRAGRLPLCACVLRLPKSGMTVFVVILDYGGDDCGRPFPMCFYAGVPTASWPGPRSADIPATERLMCELLDLRHDVTRYLNAPGPFSGLVKDRKLDLGVILRESPDTSWLTRAAEIDLAQWYEGIKGVLAVQDPQSWFRLVARWGAAISAMNPRRFSASLQFPLAAGLATEVQIAGWIHWLELHIDISQKAYSLLVSGDHREEPGSVSIVVRDLVPEDFMLITTVSHTLTYIDDAATLKPTDEMSELCDAGQGHSAELQGSWRDFVTAGPSTPRRPHRLDTNP